MKYMENLTRLVERKIDEMLPDRFAVVFEVWTTSTVHYVSLFATYQEKNEHGCSKTLLAISPMEDETWQQAQEQYGLL